MKYHDKFGREIKVGSYLVYGHALGRCAALKVGKVVALKPVPEFQNGKARISVVGVDDSWGRTHLSKVGILQFPDRCLVVDESSLSERYTKLLKEVECDSKS